MKNVKEFATYVAENLFNGNEDYEITVNEVMKNNGNLLTAVSIRKNGEPIGSNIYVNEAFERYKKGENINILLKELENRYAKSMENVDFDMELFTNFNKARNHILPKLINAEKNIKFLKDVPYVLLGDLAIIFQVEVSINKGCKQAITIRKKHKDMWGISTTTLLDIAGKNNKVIHPINIKNMHQILSEMMEEEIPLDLLLEEESPMWVMTNDIKINGATGLIHTDLIREFAELKQRSIYILPSSIHELILILDDGNIKVSDLLQMVKEVNRTQVSPEEVLSDNVYYYDIDTNSLMIAETMETIDYAIM